MGTRKWIFVGLSCFVLLMGLAFTGYSLAWTEGRLDLATCVSIAFVIVGAVGVFTAIQRSRSAAN
jgi:quinol-cytochrome oxidoreductase complex cytochrome b subunit